jgi:hypothetical protein
MRYVFYNFTWVTRVYSGDFTWVTFHSARAEQIAMVGPSKGVPTSVEQQLLDALATANGEIHHAFKAYHDLERMAISKRKEAEVQERNQVEHRLDHPASIQELLK